MPFVYCPNCEKNVAANRGKCPDCNKKIIGKVPPQPAGDPVAAAGIMVLAGIGMATLAVVGTAVGKVYGWITGKK